MDVVTGEDSLSDVHVIANEAVSIEEVGIL